MTRSEIENTCKLVKSSFHNGYVSRRINYDDLPARPYKGRYGKGYTVLFPCYFSTKYCYIEYWIEKE